MQHGIKISLLTVLTVLLFWAPVNRAGPEEDKCLTCHDNMFNKALFNFYIHRSFIDKKCLLCHVEGNTPTSVDNSRKSSRRDSPKITWLQKHYDPALTHFFLVPSVKIDSTLFVKRKGHDGRSQITSLTLPPLEQIPQYSNDGQHPRIFDIQFLGVKRGVLHSATISWQTDEPSDAQIHYGIGNFNHKTRLDHQFKTSHTLDIAPLTPGKTYTYTVVSKDIHGNRTVSQPLTFSTREIGMIEPPNDVPRSIRSSRQEELTRQLLAVGEQYFITITADRATYMNIGSHRELRPKINLPANTSSQTPPATHIPMKNKSDTNISSCLGCHKDYQSDTSHPINVRPKRGMTFPDDYPLLDDGRMHCMTCHVPHSSNTEARIRRSTKQELCIGCHKNYG